jgi:hypothetical protein
VERQQGYVGADPKALSCGGDGLEQRQLREEVEAWGDMMLARRDRIEAERANKAHLLQSFGIAASGIVACRVLRVQVDAELHRSGLPPSRGLVLAPVPMLVRNARRGKCHNVSALA